jgi:PIN domain nuclease of toxin-antitoxin system
LKLLLDTHLLLWWLSASPQLPASAAQLIADPENAIFVSAVSHWEIRLKVSLGKLRLPSDFDRRLALQGFEALPLTATHAALIATLPWLHRDPFDRMLIAQATAAQLTLLTADSALAPYGPSVKLT